MNSLSDLTVLQTTSITRTVQRQQELAVAHRVIQCTLGLVHNVMMMGERRVDRLLVFNDVSWEDAQVWSVDSARPPPKDHSQKQKETTTKTK